MPLKNPISNHQKSAHSWSKNHASNPTSSPVKKSSSKTAEKLPEEDDSETELLASVILMSLKYIFDLEQPFLVFHSTSLLPFFLCISKMFRDMSISWILAHPNSPDFPKGKRALLSDLISDVPRILPKNLITYVNKIMNCTLIQFLGKYPCLFYLDSAYVLFLPSSSFVDSISVSQDAQLTVVAGKVVSLHGKYGFAYGGKQDRIMFDIRAINASLNATKLNPKNALLHKDCIKVEDFCRIGETLQCAVFPNQLKNGKAKWVALTCIKIDVDYNNNRNSSNSGSTTAYNPGGPGLPNHLLSQSQVLANLSQNMLNNQNPSPIPKVTKIRSISMQSISECCGNPEREGTDRDLSMIGNCSMNTSEKFPKDSTKNSPTSPSLNSYSLSPSMAKVAQMYATQSIISDSVRSYQSKESELSELSGQQEAVDFIYRFLSKQDKWKTPVDRLKLYLKRHGGPGISRYINIRDPIKFILKFPYIFQVEQLEKDKQSKIIETWIKLTPNYHNSRPYPNPHDPFYRTFSGDTTNGNPDISSINKSLHKFMSYGMDSPNTRDGSFDKDFALDDASGSQSGGSHGVSHLAMQPKKPVAGRKSPNVKMHRPENLPSLSENSSSSHPNVIVDQEKLKRSSQVEYKTNPDHQQYEQNYRHQKRNSIGGPPSVAKNARHSRASISNQSVSNQIAKQKAGMSTNQMMQRSAEQLALMGREPSIDSVPASSTGSNDRVTIIKILSERPRMHVEWVWRQYNCYRDYNGNIKTLQEMIDYLDSHQEFEINPDGYVRLIDTDITPRNSDPNPNRNRNLESDSNSAHTHDSYRSVNDIINIVNRPTIGSQRKALALVRRSSTSMEMINLQSHQRPSTNDPFLNPYGFPDRTSYKFDQFTDGTSAGSFLKRVQSSPDLNKISESSSSADIKQSIGECSL